MPDLVYDTPEATEERCIKVSYTYAAKENKDGSTQPYTFKMSAIIRDKTVTLLNNTGSNIFDFRTMDKRQLIALIQCLVLISQQKSVKLES